MKDFMQSCMNLCANMEGSLDFHKLRDMPLRELLMISRSVDKIVAAKNREAQRS